MRELKNLGVDTSVPDLDNISEAVLRHCERAQKVRRKLVLHEVGGYCAGLAGKNSVFQQICAGIVEETKQGLWRYSAEASLQVPVVQFADCKFKSMEGEFVGRAVARSVDEDLATLGTGVESSHVGVVGFGDIGSGVARALRSRGARVLCYDRKAFRMIEAASQGFTCLDLQQLLDSCDAIVGATGVGRLEKKHLRAIKDGALLCSASSRNLEFPMRDIRTLREGEADLSPHVREFRFKWRKCVRVSSDGFPVNFRTLSLPSSFGDLMFCQVVKGMAAIATHALCAGIHRLTKQDEEEIAEIWFTCYRDKGHQNGRWRLAF